MSKARQTVETLRTVLVDGDVTNANFTGADLEIGKGGTGASSAGAARTALGVAIGTDVLAPDGNGSALTGVDSLPSQSSQSGKFLTTNGSAASWGEAGGGGKVLQVVSYVYTGNVQVTCGSTFTSSPVTVNITPSATSSKILIIVSGGSLGSGNTSHVHAQVYRGSTGLTGASQLYLNDNVGWNHHIPLSITYLDSPSTTSQTSYTMYVKTDESGSNGEVMINFYGQVGGMTITVMEIGA